MEAAKSAGPKMIASSLSERGTDVVDGDEPARGLDLRLDTDVTTGQAVRLLQLSKK